MRELNEIALTSSQIKILKFFQHHTVTSAELKEHFSPKETRDVIMLAADNLVFVKDNVYSGHPRGDDWLNLHKHHRLDYWVPQILSLLSIIVAVIALLVAVFLR